jgi:hypothetical protein
MDERRGKEELLVIGYLLLGIGRHYNLLVFSGRDLSSKGPRREANDEAVQTILSRVDLSEKGPCPRKVRVLRR